MDETIYKIAIAGFMHDIGKFAERAGFDVSNEFLNNNAGLYQPYIKEQNRYTHRHAVYTAAFIEKIEQFLPAEFNKATWGLGDSFENLAAGHHTPQTPMQWVIAIADRISSGFDRKEFEEYNKEIGVRDYKKTRLLTIFEGINVDGKWKEDKLESYNYRYPLKELSPENIFPVRKEEYETLDSEKSFSEYNELFNKFINSLKNLKHKQNIPLWFEHFDSLFMIYTSHIPASTVGRVVPDVSLYDHSRITSALASAIYLYHKQNGTLDNIEQIKNYEEQKFLIITGDFYGIQNFIFSEVGSTNKALAKLLRGRSFAVSLISELAADMLCRKIGLTTASIVLIGAGKFTIIAPNTKETKEKIKEVEEKINDWFVKNFYGESAIGLSFIEASAEDFTSDRFSNLWERLSRGLDKKKYSKINLEKYGGVIRDYLDQFNNKLNKKLCPFCGKRPSHPDVEDDKLLGDEKSACKICRDHIYIGTNLVKAKKIAITTIDADIHGDKKLQEPIFGEYQVSFDVDGKLISLADKGTLLKYWDISLSKDENITKDVTVKFINGYVPVWSKEDESEDTLNRLLYGEKTEKKKNELLDMIRKGDPKTFNHIARLALNPTDKPEKFIGIEALGILKADVDNLGLVFACGLKRNSLSRLATLSRKMDHYFSIYLPYLLGTQNEFKDIYTVFGGGDDLFLIGPWNKIIDFAMFINNKFNEYVCGNSQITISAGICISKPGEPVISISEKAEEALRKAKRNGRNSITLFDESTSWDKFKRLDEIKDDIQKMVESKFINNAMLYRLNTFLSLAQHEKELGSDIRIEDIECLKWRANLIYTITRNVGKELSREERAKAVDEVFKKAEQWLEKYGGAFKIPLWQIIYNQRR
ncbi:type III-A CRISPR-associated protein Cas10/Csm1 [Calditerrivibrio nitroreducens]|uniref:type III-A CRISPR-associated protein Cas10/Csm1 n=1 Tax=Calditerrivibrio nitroreducens TaxID=477976 RepID=UPI003C7447D5